MATIINFVTFHELQLRVLLLFRFWQSFYGTFCTDMASNKPVKMATIAIQFHVYCVAAECGFTISFEVN